MKEGDSADRFVIDSRKVDMIILEIDLRHIGIGFGQTIHLILNDCHPILLDGYGCFYRVSVDEAKCAHYPLKITVTFGLDSQFLTQCMFFLVLIESENR